MWINLLWMDQINPTKRNRGTKSADRFEWDVLGLNKDYKTTGECGGRQRGVMMLRGGTRRDYEY